MKFNYATEKDVKMSSKKKKSSAKSKAAEAGVFNETRSIGQNSGKIDGDLQGYSSSSVHEMTSFTDRDRFPDGNWPKDGYGKVTNLGPQPPFNNFRPGFSSIGPYARNNEDGECIRMMRNEHYTGYDGGKAGFMNNQTIDRHGSESQMVLMPSRPGFAGASGPGIAHGYGNNPPSSFMPHGHTPGLQQTYPTSTPMLTQLLRYPNPGEKFPHRQVDEYRASGPPKSWMENMAPGINQNIYPPRPTMPFYEQRLIPPMNQAHSSQISSIQASPHGSQTQPPSAPGPPGSTGVFGPSPYVQSCNPPAPPMQRLEASDKSSSQQHPQRSSSQPRPMSMTSSSLGSPNHLRPISPVPSALPAVQGVLADKKSGSTQKTSSSGSKAKKCKEEVNSIQDISSCDEGGSDSSSSTEVYSQITPMSTPSTTPLPPQGGTKPSPPGSDESPSNTPAPTIGTTGMTLSSGVVPGASPLGSSASFTGASLSSIPGTSQPLEFSLGSQGGGPTLSGLKGDHMRSTIPCSTYDVVGSKQHSYSQMQAASPMTAFNSPYSNYGRGNYARTPGAQQLDRPQGGPSQYGGQSQMYGSTGPPNMHTHQPCGNYPYPGPSKVGPGQYVQGHSQAVLSAGIHHPMEMENAVSGGAKGYGMPGGMYGPGKMGGQPVPGSMVNANMQGLHYHPAGMGQSNPPHPGQFGKTGYGAPFSAGPGNGVGPPPHHQHMGPHPTPAYGGHAPPPPNQMHQYSQRPMMSPVPQGTSGSGIGDHGSMRPASPAFYRGGPVGYEPEGPGGGGGAGNNSGRSQWVMNMQGMSGGRVMEAQCGENIPMDMPPVTIPSGGEIQRVRNPAFEPLMAKDRLSASPISFTDYTSAESKSGDMTMVPKHVDQSKIENDLSMASSSDSHGQSLMSPGPILSKSVDLDLAKKDIGSDSNSLPGQDRSRVDSDKQETLSSPPSTPFNHIASSPGSLERDIGSPSVHSSKSSSNSSVFSKIAEMGTEQDRGIFLERLFSFMSYRGTPITAVPVICKQTVDLYRLYHLVRERGGMVDVTKNKKWREVSTSLNLGASSSAGFTLKRNYAKFLFPFECRYDRGNIDPAPIILSMEMSSKKEPKRNSDRSVDMDNCRPPSNQSYSGYPVSGPIPHGMPMSDISSRGMHQGMIGGPSSSPYNGGLSSGAVGGRSGMMSPVGLAKNHSSMSRGSTESLASGQDAVSIQDPFHDGSVGPGQYPASHSAMNSQVPMYGGLAEHTSPPSAAPGSYEHRSSMPQPSAPSMYSGAPNQCMPSSMPGSGGQGNGFGDVCGGSRSRSLNETGFGNHSMHVGEYGAGGSGYGAGVAGQVQNVGCPPGGDRFDGLQSGYPGSMPMAKHTSQSESHITNDQSYYGHYGNHVPGAPSQRYKPGYDPHFFGASNQPMVSGYPGPQKIATPGVDSFSQQGHLGEGSMMGHPMGPPHPTVPYHMQKNQAPGVLGGIPKADGVYDYQAAPQVNRPDAVWMQHPFGQHYHPHPQPYPGSHGMHPNASQARDPYGMYSRFPVQNIHRYETEKQRSSSGAHYLSPSRDIVFPAGSVEATRPKLTKKRKLTYRDMGSVDAWRLMMALRSGLITESTWALDVLTILLRDDVTAPSLSLSHMPGLLEILAEHYRRCLILIFGGDFEELEVSSEMQSVYAASAHAAESQDALDDEETKTLPDPKMLAAPGNYTLKTRDGKAVGIEADSDEMLLDHKTWDVFKEFESSAFDWQMGRGDMTLHIITNLLSDGSRDFHKKKYFGMHYKTMKKKCHTLQKEDSSTGTESPVNGNSTFHSKDCGGSRSINDALCEGDHKDSVMSESAEENLANPTFPSTRPSEDDASDVPMNDGLIQESAADEASKTEPKVTMDFDNFENNQFTFAQLESLNRSSGELDEETFRPNNGVYCRLTDFQLEISQRCLCLSNIFRNLSFIPSNDNEICKHNGLMLILGKLLLLHHKHLPRLTKKSRASSTGAGGIDYAASPMEANSSAVEYDDRNLEWWWDTLEGLRENTLVMFANICGQLDLSSFPEEICLPILNGLLHWLVCSSAEALDPFTTSSLSPQRLVLEALCKLCVTDSNIDLVLATPPFSRIVLLITSLARMLSERQQVVREFAVGLLSCLVPGDSSVSRALALHHPSVTLLIEFVEDAEHHAAQVVNTHGPVVLRDNPEIMGTSLDMLCRVATILRHLVDVPENVPLISRHQERLIKLIMSPVLGHSVTAILADVLSSCS